MHAGELSRSDSRTDGALDTEVSSNTFLTLCCRPTNAKTIGSVIWAGILYVVTFPLFLLLYLPGAIAWLGISIWFLYRIVRGMVAMNNNKPVGQ